MKQENWKDIRGYEGLYQVSDFGRVKSLERYTIKKHGRSGQMVKYPEKERIMIHHTNKKTGYCSLLLQYNNKKKSALIHRLVAEAFINNIDNKPQVNHINGIKTDNRLENLEWNTRSENQLHSFKTGLQKPNKTNLGKFGKESANSKPIIRIDNNGNKLRFDCITEASRQNNISITSLINCLKRRSKTSGNYYWKYV